MASYCFPTVKLSVSTSIEPLVQATVEDRVLVGTVASVCPVDVVSKLDDLHNLLLHPHRHVLQLKWTLRKAIVGI